MKASVIISNLEPQGNLLTQLYALCTQDFPKDQYEIILPDLGNLTRAQYTIIGHLEQEHPHFRLLRGSGKNRSKMINAAARQARSALLLFIESHCIPPKDWVARAVRLFETHDIDAALGFVKTVPTHVPSAQVESKLLYDVYDRMERLGTKKSFFDFHNSAITKACFDELGGFDEGLPMMMEFELGARLYKNKKRVHQFKENEIWHNTDATFRNYDRIIAGQGRDRGRMIQRFGVQYMHDYFPMPRFLALLPLLRAFRIPAFMLASALTLTGGAGFHVAQRLRLGKRAAGFWFNLFAKNSLRRGILLGLKKSEAVVPRRR